jgi:hypothetical protein
VSKRVVREGVCVSAGVSFSLPISKSNKGYYLDIIQAIGSQLESMLSHYSRVLTVRFDLHLYDPTVTNQCISRFFRKCRKRLKCEYGLVRMGFAWCREQNKGTAQHYHCVLILDGHKVNYPNKVLTIVDSIWEGWGHVKPYTPRNCYYFVLRGDVITRANVMVRLSYLAKVYSKGLRLSSVNDYSTSRIKSK